MIPFWHYYSVRVLFFCSHFSLRNEARNGAFRPAEFDRLEVPPHVVINSILDDSFGAARVSEHPKRTTAEPLASRLSMWRVIDSERCGDLPQAANVSLEPHLSHLLASSFPAPD